MGYLKVKQVDSILEDQMSNENIGILFEEVEELQDTLESYFEFDKKTEKDRAIKEAIADLKALKRRMDVIGYLDININTDLEHTAICNEIYDRIEADNLIRSMTNNES